MAASSTVVGRGRDLRVRLVHMECLCHFYNARDIYSARRGAKKGDGVEEIMKADE